METCHVHKAYNTLFFFVLLTSNPIISQLVVLLFYSSKVKLKSVTLTLKT